ncbi:MAG: TIGR03560 family F420-dependent LLM class oxidoreductase [Anaerolineales bacterium]
MIEIAIMIEGQHGLNWPRWKRIARAVEELGFAGLYRSDHFTNASPPDRDSLELWTSLTWLADHTERIEFGPLVTPLSFRDPVFTARMAREVDDLSGGRLTLGVGAGWQEREHTMFGYDLLDVSDRFERFEEGLQVISGLLREADPVNFEGRFYRLQEAQLLPRPQRPGGPPLLIGGNGPRRSLPLAAKYADEWNGVYITPEAYRKRIEMLDEGLAAGGRDPGSVRRSVMTGLVFASDRAEIEKKVEFWQATPEELRQHGLIVGTGSQVTEAVAAYERAGAGRIMLQWLELDDLDGLQTLARLLLG